MQKRWDGLLVCKKDFELDHPQKFLRVRETGQAVPIIRDEPEDVFAPSCTFQGTTAYAGIAVAGCSRVGHAPPISFIVSLSQSNCIAGIATTGDDFVGVDSFI